MVKSTLKIENSILENPNQFSGNLKVVEFEEAIRLVGFGKFQYMLIVFAGIFMTSSFWETMNVNYILPISECDLGITSKKQYGIVTGVWFAGIILTSQLWGFLSDTYGRRKILIVASLATFITSALSTLSINYIHLVAFRFLNGCFIAGSQGTIFAYLGEFIDSKSRSNSIMFASFIYGLTCISLPFIALLVINNEWRFIVPVIDIVFKPWRLFILICSLPSLISGLISFFLPESPKFTYQCLKDEEKTVNILRKIQRINKGTDDLEFKLKPISNESNEVDEKKSVIRLMREQVVELVSKYPRSFGIASSIQFGSFFVAHGMLVFFPDILNQTANYVNSNKSINVKMCEIIQETIANKSALADAATRICVEKFDISVYWFVIYLETCYVSGFLIISILLWIKVHRLYVLNFIYITAGVAGILIVFIDNVTASSFFYVFLLTSGLTFSLINTIVFELVPTHLRSLAINLVSMLGRTGSLIGGNFAGILLESYCDLTFFVSGILMFICAIGTFTIPRIFSKHMKHST